MTFIIRKNSDGSGEVENTESTEITLTKAQVHVGGSFKNMGKVRILEGGILDIDKDFLNEGNLAINEKPIIMEALKTAKSVSELGTEILKKLNLIN